MVDYRGLNDANGLIGGFESKIADPAVYGQTEWISVMFHGQSFMLHQVRSSITICESTNWIV